MRCGFFFYIPWSIAGESDPDYTESPRDMNLGAFVDNVAHSNYYEGIRFQNLHRNDINLHGDIINAKVYRNQNNGIFGYYSRNFAIKGGFFADNRYHIYIARCLGVSEISDAVIYSETQHQRNLVASQGALTLRCDNGNPIQGIRIATFRNYPGYEQTMHLKNLRFWDFDKVSDCSNSAPIYLSNLREDDHFDFNFHVTNLTVNGLRGQKTLSACAAAATNINDVVITDLDGSLDPNPAPEFTGVASAVSNQPFMTAFADGLCDEIEDSCMTYCRDTCLRTVSWLVEGSGTEGLTLHVFEEGGARKHDVPSNYWSRLDEQSKNDYLKLRKFSVSLPAGKWSAEFHDENGDVSWPSFAEEIWEPAPPCQGHVEMTDIQLLVPPLSNGECDNLIKHSDMEHGTYGPWHANSRGTLIYAKGMGIGGSNAVASERTDYYASIGHYLDIRCLRDNMFKQFEIKAWVKIMNGATPVSCDPNSSDIRYRCPLIGSKAEYYENTDTKNKMKSRSQNHYAEAVRPHKMGEFNLLHGTFVVDDYDGIPMVNKTRIYLYISHFAASDLFIDNVTVTPIEESCNELVQNGKLNDTFFCFA